MEIVEAGTWARLASSEFVRILIDSLCVLSHEAKSVVPVFFFLFEGFCFGKAGFL